VVFCIRDIHTVSVNPQAGRLIQLRLSSGSTIAAVTGFARPGQYVEAGLRAARDLGEDPIVPAVSNNQVAGGIEIVPARLLDQTAIGRGTCDGADDAARIDGTNHAVESIGENERSVGGKRQVLGVANLRNNRRSTVTRIAGDAGACENADRAIRSDA